MTLDIKYDEIVDPFSPTLITITNNTPSSMRLLKITSVSTLFNFKLSTDGVSYSEELFLFNEILSGESLNVYTKADETVIDRIITTNLVNLKVEYV